ncbi:MULTISPECIES: SH3 domain-containing protein [unclassified Streptomyces]|uniref:SH3 domain-containing protein n=1 Tax=unclassified Streptomyces TaxID=2593676 RepID=UPI003681BF91
MSLRSPRGALTRLAIATAAGALLASVAATPALADDEGGGGGEQSVSRGDGWNGDGGGDQTSGRDESWNGNGGDDHGDQHDPRLYRGVVTASELFLRSAPNRGSQVIRVAHRGERVSIFCKTTGQNIQGNNLWYLLTDGTWAWGAARYIDTIGPTPRWC